MIDEIRPETFDLLRPFQREALVWGLQHRNWYLHAPAGSGKTPMSLLWGLDTPANEKLIVTTKTAVRRQWRDEVQRWTNVEAQILEGETAATQDPLNPEARVYIIGYDTLPAHVLRVRDFAKTVIFDEIHRVKSHKRWSAIVDPEDPTGKPQFSLKDNQAAAAMLLSRASRRRCGASATPIPNRRRDLWAQLDLLQPGKHGGFYAWAKTFCAAKPGEYGGIDTSGESNDELLITQLEKLMYSIPFSRANAELPPKRRTVYRIPVTEQINALGIAEEMKAAARAGPRFLFELKLAEAASRKRRILLSYVKDAVEHDKKIIVFTGRRKDCDYLGNAIVKICKRVWCGHGGHSESDRHEMKRAYMAASGPAVLVGTIDAWGESHNLQDTDVVYVTMLPWRPADVIQLEGRVARQGQRRPVEIVFLIAESTVDTRVASVILSKLPAIENVIVSEELDGLTSELRGGTDEELLDRLFDSF